MTGRIDIQIRPSAQTTDRLAEPGRAEPSRAAAPGALANPIAKNIS